MEFIYYFLSALCLAVALEYTGLKKLSPICICLIDAIQNQSYMFYRNSLLNSNCCIIFSAKKQQYELDFTFVDKFSAESHAFQQRPCFVPYYFYSKIGIKKGAPENSING